MFKRDSHFVYSEVRYLRCVCSVIEATICRLVVVRGCCILVGSLIIASVCYIPYWSSSNWNLCWRPCGCLVVLTIRTYMLSSVFLLRRGSSVLCRAHCFNRGFSQSKYSLLMRVVVTNSVLNVLFFLLDVNGNFWLLFFVAAQVRT
jgi:hypothetical protein